MDSFHNVVRNWLLSGDAILYLDSFDVAFWVLMVVYFCTDGIFLDPLLLFEVVILVYYQVSFG
jgi:hypothetical protein